MKTAIKLVILLFIFFSCEKKKDAMTAEDYAHAEKFKASKTYNLMHDAISQSTWNDQDQLLYRHTLPNGEYEFRVSDMTKIDKAFDHAKLADALSKVTDKTINPMKIGISNLSLSKNTLEFSYGGDSFTADLSSYKLKKHKSLLEGSSRNYVISPDGKLAAFRKEHNLWILNLENGKKTQLTRDGIEDYGYATNDAGWTRGSNPVVLWSPQSDKIATFKHDSRKVDSYLYLTKTTVGAPKLDKYKYPLPGDKDVFMIDRVVIHVNTKKIVKLKMPQDFHRSTTTDHIAGRGGKFLDVEWSKDGKMLAFVSSSRDHKTATLKTANPFTGDVKTVHSETEDTFYESGIGMSNWHILKNSNEAIWFSEKDDWGHLYLHDLTTGKEKLQITKGNWAVHQVINIDEENRQIYFNAGGKEDGDPYFWYTYRINMDGSNLVNLTPSKGHHSVSISPSGKYLLDTYSTPQIPPVSVIRDMNGKEVQTLATANIDALIALGWKAPESFVTKARDGVTDIHGILYKPNNLDESQKYPIINYLYPGPQSGSVGSRAFRPTRRNHQAMAELGFIVVELDAMGTPGRSKSFHEAYYGNMGDNGLPDQKAGIEQLAAKYKWMDLDRVGIFGHSGGGFASTAAIFQYPDFYKVAVSSSGNHDNRNYEDDWGEKWHGLLEKSEAGTDNYDKQANQYGAKNLKGKLLLAHGLVDDNVPPSNTLLVVDALIKANKDFDLVVFPNARHGYYPDSDYFSRRRWDYFVKHLKGMEPPKEFKFSN